MSPIATPTPNLNPGGVKYGAFIRSGPDGAPYGMFTSFGSKVLSATKTQNLLDIGVSWGRSGVDPRWIEQAYNNNAYDWSTADIVMDWELAHNIQPVIQIDAGPVIEFASPTDAFPTNYVKYPTTAAYATFCSGTVAHYKPKGITAYSIPGNEVNSDFTEFPKINSTDITNAAAVAPYAVACYHAIKAIDPNAFVWAFELNGEGSLNSTQFVTDAKAAGCAPGTCYDGISFHTGIHWTFSNGLALPATGPCFPNAGGDYTTACVTDLQKASGNPILPIMIGEYQEVWPNGVPDATAQAIAVPTGLKLFASILGVRYIAYADLDECALYVGGFFQNGCLVDVNNNHVPAWQPAHNVFTGQ